MPMPVLPATIAHALREAATRIGRVDAEALLLHVLGQPRGWLFAHDRDALTPEQFGRFDALAPAQLAAFNALVERREAGEPVGAATSTCSPRAIAGQASACAGVGDGKRWPNQPETAGWKAASAGGRGMPELSGPAAGRA